MVGKLTSKEKTETERDRETEIETERQRVEWRGSSEKLTEICGGGI